MNQMLLPQRQTKRLGHLMIFLAFVFLACVIFLSSKAGGVLLTKAIESGAAPVSLPATTPAQAIVVLTGGDWRIREAARLQRETGLPVLASGGDGEADAIKKHLESDFHVPVRWTEGRSLNTEQNALFSAAILARENIQTIFLVTHALHMRRARMMFSDRGFEVIAAPTDFSSHAPFQWGDFLPSPEGRKLAKSALHETVGLVWYRARQLFR